VHQAGEVLDPGLNLP